MSSDVCGGDPACSGGGNVDTTLGMTVAGRYRQQATPPQTRDGCFETMAPRQVESSPALTETMDESRKMEVAALRERVVRSEYEVDSRAVASAILAHLLAERPASSTPAR